MAAEQVVFAAKSLAERLHEALAAEALTCVRVGVEVTGADGRTLTRLWRHDGALSALAVAERVRWQLSSWETQGEDGQEGGVVLLRLLPDQLVADDGRQEALWGEATVSDQIARAAARVQAMLGHQAITWPFPAAWARAGRTRRPGALRRPAAGTGRRGVVAGPRPRPAMRPSSTPSRCPRR